MSTQTLAALTSSLLLAATAAQAEAPKPFTFFAVQFAPRAQQEGLAKAFVAKAMPAGVPMDAALQRAKAAGARCARADASGVVACRASNTQKRPGDDLSDIVYTIHITPAVDGTVAAADVTRVRSGF